MELVFPPGGAFEYAGFVAFFANVFGGIGVWIDFEVGFGGHYFKRILEFIYAGLRPGGTRFLRRWLRTGSFVSAKETVQKVRQQGRRPREGRGVQAVR